MPSQADLTGAANLTRAPTPDAATYMIDGQAFTMREGEFVVEQYGGAAAKNVVRVFGEPVRGDLDGDGVADAVQLLVQTRGGSGTFYYLTALFDHGGSFVSSEAVFLGDRIAPQQLAIWHGLVVVDYAVRLPDQAMTVPPSMGMTKYLVSRGGRLEEVLLADGELITAGVVVIGHEVHSFTPCDTGQPAWLIGSSPALQAIKTAYRLVMADAPVSSPLFMLLSGRPVATPFEGFGIDYPTGFHAEQLVLSRSVETCI